MPFIPFCLLYFAYFLLVESGYQFPFPKRPPEKPVDQAKLSVLDPSLPKGRTHVDRELVESQKRDFRGYGVLGSALGNFKAGLADEELLRTGLTL